MSVQVYKEMCFNQEEKLSNIMQVDLDKKPQSTAQEPIYNLNNYTVTFQHN